MKHLWQALAVGAIALGFMFGAGFADPVLQAPAAKPLEFPPQSGIHLVYIAEVYDGDSGKFYWLVEDHWRTFGINSPELNTPEGKAAKAAAQKLLPAGLTTVKVFRRDKYGRSLLAPFSADGKDVGQVLIEKGYAIGWDGQGKKPVPKKDN